MVEQAEKEQPGIFGPGGADAQAFALFNVAMAGGILVGPILAGALVEAAGWLTMSLVLGAFALSAGVPAVSSRLFLPLSWSHSALRGSAAGGQWDYRYRLGQGAPWFPIL